MIVQYGMEQDLHVSRTGNLHRNRDRQLKHRESIPLKVVNTLIVRVDHLGKGSLGGGERSLLEERTR